MTGAEVATILIAILLVIGTLFTLVAAIGLLKLTNPMSRLHAPTKAGTLGIGAYLLASMVHSYTVSDGSFHELLIMGFLFITAPVSANFIAKVHIHTRASATPPPPLVDDTWSTLEVPPEDADIEVLEP